MNTEIKERSLGERPINLLPGQYFDKETNTHYNYYRDYEPSTGRYVESDPAGLDGGLNTFIYVLSNPLQNSDPSGQYIPGVHNSITYTQARGTCVDSQAAELGQKAGDVDSAPGSQSPINSYRHNMCSPSDSALACNQKISRYIDEQLSQCTLDGLANALHDIEDGYPPGHSGGQTWRGMPGTKGGESWLSALWHGIRDLFPATGAAARATKQAINNWCQKCSKSCAK
jgi:RHS repeat-associated protein